MGNTLKFNSSVCTSIAQSQRLLDLGLKPETADMSIITTPIDCDGIKYSLTPYSKTNHPKVFGTIPAWSLHRLIDLCGTERMPISFYKKGKAMIRVNHIHPTHNGRSNYNHYDSLIDCIEWLINENYFNKEYLNESK